MSKYGLDGSVMRVSIETAITPTVMVEVEMTTPGAALLLAELYQARGDREKAIGLLENLVDVAPDNPAIALSLAELYSQEGLWQELASMPVRIENTDDLSAEVLRYKARAMRETGMLDGALEVLKEALKSKKRHPEILKAARYERALTYGRWERHLKRRGTLSVCMRRTPPTRTSQSASGPQKVPRRHKLPLCLRQGLPVH
jgi:tetratricopeptide (TPR) repeat protein